ncbi:hypothetical protein M758_6G131900 [Ceratodon purpureus]|nr:hypothetical protein M758_6G131900 [Ceratodon purpureus]
MKCATSHKCGLEDSNLVELDALERESASRKLKRAVVFCLFFMGIEVIGGLYANSLAILTDAAHLLCDIAGFAISLFAIWATSWESTAIQSYGFFRLEILGALVSIQFIWLVTGMLLYEAIGRLYDSESDPVDGSIMLGIAILGLIVNICMIVLLGHEGHGMHLGASEHDHGHEHGHGHGHQNKSEDDSGHKIQDKHGKPSDKDGEHQHISFNEHATQTDMSEKHDIKQSNSVISKTISEDRHRHSNLNLEGAYLHVLGDALQSVGIIIGGAAIWYNPEWKIIDVICTLMFSMLVLSTTIQMLKDILHILMESTPREINAQAVKVGLEELPGVIAIHELHIWALTMGKTLLTCHIQATPRADHDEVLKIVVDYLETRFKITHATIQIETAS